MRYSDDTSREIFPEKRLALLPRAGRRIRQGELAGGNSGTYARRLCRLILEGYSIREIHVAAMKSWRRVGETKRVKKIIWRERRWLGARGEREPKESSLWDSSFRREITSNGNLTDLITRDSLHRWKSRTSHRRYYVFESAGLYATRSVSRYSDLL